MVSEDESQVEVMIDATVEGYSDGNVDMDYSNELERDAWHKGLKRNDSKLRPALHQCVVK